MKKTNWEDRYTARQPAPTPSPKARKPMKRVSDNRRKENAVYLKLAAIYKEQNPACVHCGYHMGDELQCDHIVSGTAGRAASLLNFDTINSVCQVDHDKGYSQAEKAAAKLCHVLRTIERLRQQNFSFADELLIIKAVMNRKPGWKE